MLEQKNLEQISIDVSELSPPQPMTQILESLANLTPMQMLVVKHRREPFPLYSKLVENGWAYRSQKIAENHIVICIAHHRNTMALASLPMSF